MLRILTLTACLLAARPASANLAGVVDAAMRAVERDDLALWLARVSANEGALYDRREMDLVWQTVEENGGRDYSDWLRRHSPRVHGVPGMKACKPGRNCEWSRQLNRAGMKPPAMTAPDDWWEVVMRPTWLDLVLYADYLVAGGEYNRPCARAPRTWGNDRDAAGAATRGLYPMHCDARFNDGYAPPPRERGPIMSIPYNPVEVAWLR